MQARAATLAARLVGLLAVAARALAARAERLAGQLTPPAVAAVEGRETVRGAMRAHDMVDAPDEAYYRERYLEWMLPLLEEAGALEGRILDAGCGSGRLLVPLAEAAGPRGGTVVGVDYLDEAIAAARELAATVGLGGIELQVADILDFLRAQADASYDAIVFIEAGFVMPQLETALREMHRVLTAGGVLIVSLRSRWFLAQLGVAERNWELARAAMNAASGRLPGIGWQNLHSANELSALLTSAGFEPRALHAIGAASGIEGDPLARLARPTELTAREQADLAAVEDALGRTHPDTGRYILAHARRAPSQR